MVKMTSGKESKDLLQRQYGSSVNARLTGHPCGGKIC